MKRSKLFVVAVATWLVGCNSVPPYDGTPLGGSNSIDDESDEEANDTDPTSLDGLGGDEDPGAPAPSTKAGACSGEATQKACFECCTEKAPDAVDVYTKALEACLCESPGACQAACGTTLCAGYKADSACAECLRSQGTSCEDAAFSSCEKSSTCAPMLECASDSRCGSK